MTRATANPWLSYYAWFTAGATLLLICVGGLVTSHGAGLAVPDWPNTYGYNMFLFPVSKWVGGIFYEHTHRLAAAGVGLATLVLAVWLWLKESRPWSRWLGGLALASVVLQGVLGGLRVTLYKDQIGIFHAALAQLFLVLVSLIALLSTQWWQKLRARPVPDAGLHWLVVLSAALVMVQLMLGAAMRHQHAGLAIPDFPLAYGRLWPATTPEAVAVYNQNRVEVSAARPITAFQIVLQMLHRLGALAVLLAVAACARTAGRQAGWAHPVGRLSLAWLALILAQVGLGAATIWTDKSADVATAHVAVGALSLVVGAVLSLLVFRCLAPVTAGSRFASDRSVCSLRALGRGEDGSLRGPSPFPLPSPSGRGKASGCPADFGAVSLPSTLHPSSSVGDREPGAIREVPRDGHGDGNRSEFLPLPWGEGWGEGKSDHGKCPPGARQEQLPAAPPLTDPVPAR